VLIIGDVLVLEIAHSRRHTRILGTGLRSGKIRLVNRLCRVKVAARLREIVMQKQRQKNSPVVARLFFREINPRGFNRLKLHRNSTQNLTGE
jgi:hypothetical protein